MNIIGKENTLAAPHVSPATKINDSKRRGESSQTVLSNPDEPDERKKMSKGQQVLYALSQPKLYTPHYNMNGRNVYTSKITIITFSLALAIFVSV